MLNTKIQWADDTANPVMGCYGCELWQSFSRVTDQVTGIVLMYSSLAKADVLVAMQKIQESTYPLRKELIKKAAKLIRDKNLQRQALVEMKALTKCYAATLVENRGGKIKGYPQTFDEPEMFPGRMEKIARLKSLKGLSRSDKPWIDGSPRLIFVSDMGDALSKNISFDYLLNEIVRTACSETGKRHVWLWLTKRPDRMAMFARWLESRGIPWPKNLVAMTTVTSQKTVGRIKQLRKVPAICRGLSIEPLWSSVDLDLSDIDWVIVGGESGTGASPCHMEWFRDIREQCSQAGVAFFVKQLGSQPREDNEPLVLKDRHGGDWAEWPADLKIRKCPDFSSLV